LQLPPLWLLKFLPNMNAAHVTILHGIQGASNTITCGEPSGHLAIAEAFRTIRRGAAELAICGGVESKLNLLSFARQCVMLSLNPNANEMPEAALRPFDEQGNGTIVGEGGGLLILEEREHAIDRGARIYAELAGVSSTFDLQETPVSTTLRTPPPKLPRSGYARSIYQALAMAKCSPDSLSVLLPKGVGIAEQDRNELHELRSIFPDASTSAAICTIKGQTGNLFAGSSLEAVAAVKALYEHKIPASVNSPKEIERFSLPNAPISRASHIESALTIAGNDFGQNSALVFRRYHEESGAS